MFRTEASKTRTGNWLLDAACEKGHTVFKDQYQPRIDYKCPFCGENVN